MTAREAPPPTLDDRWALLLDIDGILVPIAGQHGLLPERVAPGCGEQWCSVIQTYRMAGLIDCAILVSGCWG